VATGKQTEPGAAPPSVKEQIEMILNRAEHVLEKEALYSTEDQATIWHGASLRVVEAVHVHAAHALGILKVDTALLPEHTYSYVHPALLNGGLLTGLTLLEKSWGGSFLPLMIKELRVYGEVGTSCYALAELVTSNREMLEVNYRLCNEQGAVLVEVLGFVCKRVLVDKDEDVTTDEVADQAHETLLTEVDTQLAEAFIREQLAGLISEDVSKVSSTRNFMDLGVDSSQLIALVRQLEVRLDTELYPTLFFEHQNIAELSAYLIQEYPHAFRRAVSPSKMTMSHSRVTKPVAVPSTETPPDRSSLPKTPIAPLHVGKSNPQARASTSKKASSHPDPIAVIGMHGVFPGSRDKEAFWDHLYGQSDLVKEIPEDHFDYRPWYDTNPEAEDKMYCKWGSFIEEVDQFDAGFFNISPREAEWMDPQLRYLLQVLYGTAEDAGVINQIRGTNTGLYVGVCFHDYTQQISEQVPGVHPHEGTGNAATMLANRPSFYFNLTGPSMAINTACSSSLVALHTAVGAMERGECDQAFVAGANLLLASHHYRYFCSIGALSRSGRSHTFDHRADG
ncbi:MAG: beta-ketoacyl synthase N-terminal-like domain-containing protein, partial [Verrucomicrobiota bacterium]